MDDLVIKKVKMTAEIATILKHSKMQSLQKNRGAHYERLARDAEAKVEKLREAIKTIDAEIAAAKA